MHIVKRIFGYSLPFLLTLLFVGWYSYWEISLKQSLKVTGLVGILLFALTFFVGPLCKFFPKFDGIKVFRKYWGITATLFITAHLGLAYYVTFKSSLARLFSLDFSGDYGLKRLGVWLGIIAFAYFVFMVLISNRFAMAKLQHRWKTLQTIGYVPFTLALTHFILVETDPKFGFVVRKPLGRMVFALIIAALVMRLYVWIWTKFTKAPEPSIVSPTPQSFDSPLH